MQARRLRMGLGIALAAFVTGAGPAAAGSTLTCKRIPQLVSHLLGKHVSHRTLTDEIRDRSAEFYLERIDPSKTLFLESEADQIRDTVRTLFARAQSGDCSALPEINQRVVSRSQELEGLVRASVSRGDFAIDPDTELIVDPDERGRPKTDQEREALVRDQIDFQLANYVSAGTPLAEARERLVHRYELFSRRARELEPEDLHASFLDAFAASLDPHSSYLSADALEDFQIAMSLSLEGIGVALASRDGYAVVERVLPGGAVDRAHSLRPNDRIIAVGQEQGEMVDVIDMALRDVVRLIRGKRGTPVRLLVLREADKTERFQVTIVRDKIDLEEQTAKLRFETVPRGERTLKLAVLELTSFYGDKDPSKRQCADDVARLLEQVRGEKAEGLVLDLSRNGGGLLEYAVQISGYFLREAGIVAVRERDGPTQVLEDPEHDLRYEGPLVVLISRATASASEILAGALKDYGRAVIVGDDHSFGKGTVQTVVPLGHGLGALKVTTAMFFRPGGLSTQRSGVRSDVAIPSLFNTDRFGEASQPHALPPQRIPPFLSAAANSDRAEERWLPVSEQTLGAAADRSRSRVDQSEAFRAIELELAEREGSRGVVRVAEILDGKPAQSAQSEPQAGGAGAAEDAQLASAEVPSSTEEEPEDEDRLTPQAAEALEILADLVLDQEALDG